MAGFQVDMSPLINSSMAQAQATQGIGQALGGGIEAIGNAYQQTRQQDAQTALNDLTSRAMGGDTQAFQQLMTQSPDNARQVATYLRQTQDQEYKVGEQQKKVQMIGASDLMERIHLESDPITKQLMIDEAILDKTNDIDEEDRGMFMSPEGQKAFIGSVKGEDYANNFFGANVQKFSSVQQKVAAEGINPNSTEGHARAREITQGSRTDPSLKPSDQALINKASEGQLASSGFANRVASANDILSTLEAKINFDPTAISTAVLESVPGGNLALSDDEQLFSQAKKDFITAVLRKESGAAIGVDEFDNEDRKYFPQVGDGKKVMEQKARGRKRALASLKAQSKGVYSVQFGSKEGDLTQAEIAELKQLREELGQ